MPKGPRGERRPADAVGCAATIAKIATGEIENTGYGQPNIVRAGQDGACARTYALTPEQRSEIAKHDAADRWSRRESQVGVPMSLTDPGKIAATAEIIYKERYREAYEKDHSGQFVAIDVQDGAAYLGEFPEDALQQARERAPHGVFHLIRIGSPGAFRVSYVGEQSACWNWTLRPTG